MLIVGVCWQVNEARAVALSINPAPNQRFVLRIAGAPNQTYQVRTTSDFISWNSLGAVTLDASGTGSITDSPATVFPQRFYQVGGSSVGYLDNGLIAYWKLSDGGGSVAVDATGNGNALSLIGAPSWGGNYLALNGSTQFGDAGTNAAELAFQDMSISAWIKKTGSSYKAIADKSFDIPGYGYGGWGLRIQADGHLQFWGGQACVDNGTQTIHPGEWTFVTVVWHAASYNADFYINGILNSINNNGATVNLPTDGNAHLQLGNLQNNSGNGIYAFDGFIRDVGIYNRALSAAEVATNFLATEPSTLVLVPDNLYLKMGEANSNVVNPPIVLADSSTLANTNVVFNAPYSIQWETNQADIPHSALHFNGSAAYVDAHAASAFNFTTNSFTINLWLMPQTANGFVMGNSIPQTCGWFMSVGPIYQIFFGSETPGAENILATTKPGADWPTSYNMVTVTRNGTDTPLIYFNGHLAETTGSFVSPASSTNNLVIGAAVGGSRWLDGNIWQPQIWSTNLSSSDVANLYLKQSAGIPWP